MAEAIILKGKAVAELSDYTACEFALSLEDNGAVIPATFSMDLTSTGTKPMAGIAQYGRITALMDSNNEDTSLTVTATPLDGGSAVTAATTLATLVGGTIGSSIAAI